LDRSIFRLEPTSLGAKWDEFVAKSTDGTVFSYSAYLRGIRENPAVYYCLKNKEIKAGVAVIETNDSSSAILNDFVIYNGVMYAPPLKEQNRATVRSDQFEIASFVAEELAKRYRDVSLRLPPSIIDIRPFLWYNYNSDLPQYVARVLYTSYVSLEGLLKEKKIEEIPLFRECSYARRQEIRYAIKKGVVTKEEFHPDQFVEFYRLTMERQSKEVLDFRREAMKYLIATLCEQKLGRMFISYTAEGKPGSMAFWGVDNKRAHYIFGANDPQYRDEHVGTAVIWDSFFELSASGVKEVNLEGVNSPQRGWFKLSFGGDLRPYFQLTIKAAP
jgi:hypothetical protein